MSVEAVRNYLKPYGIADHIIEFDASSATVEEAAEDLGCKPALIAKTMACMVGEKAVLVVCAGDAKLWSSAFKKEFGTKPKFFPADELRDIVGHPVCGVCPFALKGSVEIYHDCTFKRFDTVFPAAGSANSAVEITFPELEERSQAEGLADVCKGWRDKAAE